MRNVTLSWTRPKVHKSLSDSFVRMIDGTGAESSQERRMEPGGARHHPSAAAAVGRWRQGSRRWSVAIAEDVSASFARCRTEGTAGLNVRI